MYDYMKALYDRFYQPSAQTEQLKKEVDATHKTLSEQLDKPKRRLLLQLVDEADALISQKCLESFACGYRLAHGIHQELLPPYDFEEDEARRAYTMLRGEG